MKLFKAESERRRGAAVDPTLAFPGHFQPYDDHSGHTDQMKKMGGRKSSTSSHASGSASSSVVEEEINTVTVPPPRQEDLDITMRVPENVIGETLTINGRVEFDNLLRIDGHFEGELVGTGSLIIGPTGEVMSDLAGLREVYVEGVLVGDVQCEKMQIRVNGCVTGNVQCASLGMDQSVILRGSTNVVPADRNKNVRHGSRKRNGKERSLKGDKASSAASSTVEMIPPSPRQFDGDGNPV
ncbi:unnamed protein product [Discosporangium mesarthrocarpum]